jgi:alpha-beta hydrolase superfamily lysophospholipase
VQKNIFIKKYNPFYLNLQSMLESNYTKSFTMFKSSVIKRNFKYLSSNGEHNIFTLCWIPENKVSVKAILQIAHGMAEHADRYDNFARFMVNHGFAVYANAHAGHGHSVNEKEEKGYFGAKNGRNHLVEDMHQLTDIAKKEWPEKPLFLLGHSMGSFLSRKYTIKYNDELSGVIYMGTGNGNPFLKTGIVISGLLCKIKGSKASGKFLDKLAFGNFNKRVPDARSNFDWLSANKENVDNYLHDPLNGFIFTNSGFYELFSLINEVTNKHWAKQLPADLPILLISGEEDPVGAFKTV